MKRSLELSLIEEALAARGLLDEEYEPTLDDLPPDPWADHYDVILSLPEAPARDEAAVRAEINRVMGMRHEMSVLQAEEYRSLARLSAWAREGAGLFIRPDVGEHKAAELAHRSMIAELALATGVSARTMAVRVADAEQLVNDFPHTLEELASGTISTGHVRVIVEHGVGLTDPETRADYEMIVLREAVLTTPGRLRRFAELTAGQAGTETFQERHDRAAAGRNVRMTKLPDGMAEIIHLVPSVLAAGIWDRLTAQAKALSQAGDPRTFDQLRSDLAAELLLTGEPSATDGSPHSLARAINAEVAVVIPALTLLGRSDEPATLAGAGPIGLDEARNLAAEAPTLVRILTHPVSGLVLSVDTYRPSEQMRRFLRIRDGRCRFPGCTRPPGRCDLDHTIAAEDGGPTTTDNLAHLCRGDHTLKHHGGWSVRQIEPGVLEWTSPHGIVQIDRPEPTVRFAA